MGRVEERHREEKVRNLLFPEDVPGRQEGSGNGEQSLPPTQALAGGCQVRPPGKGRLSRELGRASQRGENSVGTTRRRAGSGWMERWCLLEKPRATVEKRDRVRVSELPQVSEGGSLRTEKSPLVRERA